MATSFRIAVIQFPGTNTERETMLAVARAGMEPVEFLWNEPREKLTACDGFILAGGFAYEDRSRAGILAALDPVIDIIREESERGKPVLGICNGAQILVEAGLVPGLENYRLGMALTHNKRVQNSHIIGVGYYNTWAYLRQTVPADRCAFTLTGAISDKIHIPLAHAEGRFVIPQNLLDNLIANDQTVYRYCDGDGNILPEFPTNPNGSVYNLAAVCNPTGNVMAIMPHPERSLEGDCIFNSMRTYIQRGIASDPSFVSYHPERQPIKNYSLPLAAREWILELLITDNEALSVQNALQQRGLEVSIKRYVHWEVSAKDMDPDQLQRQIHDSGELWNTNKERFIHPSPQPKTAFFLVRDKEDLLGRQKLETLTNRFGMSSLQSIYRGNLWSITANHKSLKTVVDQVLDTHILFNPYSQRCYEYHP
jgi:phosphoribosylformylglycinamidine synthase